MCCVRWAHSLGETNYTIPCVWQAASVARNYAKWLFCRQTCVATVQLALDFHSPTKVETCDTRANSQKPSTWVLFYWANPPKLHQNTHPKLISTLVPCSTNNETFLKICSYFKNFKPVTLCKFSDIYLTWTISSSAHSNNLDPKTYKTGSFKKIQV